MSTSRRRREYFEGLGFAFLGLMVLVTTVTGDRRDNNQDKLFQACIVQQVTELTDSLTARTSLTEPDADSVRELITGLLAADGDQAAGQVAIGRYIAAQDRLAKVRKENPIPPFPNGKCEGL